MTIKNLSDRPKNCLILKINESIDDFVTWNSGARIQGWGVVNSVYSSVVRSVYLSIQNHILIKLYER
jgi:hypothetical protein